MAKGLSYRTLAEVIQRRVEERKEADRQAVRPAVTIARSTGSGGYTIGAELGLFLNAGRGPDDPPWAVLDTELVARVLEDHGLPQQLAEHFPEDEFSTISDAIAEMMGLHPTRWTFVQKTTATVRNLCRMGHVVIVGRGANIMAADMPGVLHIRLIGSMPKRIARVKVDSDLTRDEAVEYIRSTDRARAAFVKQHFDKSVDDPLLYHLVINTDRLTDSAVVHVVGDAIRALDISGTQRKAD